MEDASAPLRLPAVLDLAAAGPLHADLLLRLGAPVTVDASAVRRLGGQCLQVLLAARRRWREDGAAFELADPSDDFTEALALFGASDLSLDDGRAPAELAA